MNISSSAFNLSTITAGFIAVLIGYSSSAVIIFQAAEAAGASQAQLSSWMWAVGIGCAFTTLYFSWRYRQPILTAWSTPGAALLATSLPGTSMEDAIGAFILSSLLITLCGITGWFERIMHRLPPTLAAAMLAGVLLRFGLDVFQAADIEPGLVLPMLLAYLLGKCWWPRFAVLGVLITGGLLAYTQGDIALGGVDIQLTVPQWTTPHFTLTTLIGVGIPLFVVTMASQNLPGIAVIRAAGYQAPVSPVITGTGLISLILAPFGGYAINLAAISAAVCMGPEAHPDPKKRYGASLIAGALYLTCGLLGATVASLFGALPSTLVMAIAGIALMPTLANGLASAMGEPGHRDAAILTFLVTASGFSLFSIGSAFWGLIAGVIALNLRRVTP
ncbi:hypothetical protein BFW38_15830 [Terasakiispira papahanaumokuakeensis]|uniref:Benzoate transporter n=1 Tax=Terasakiispira papahanaumokuakeensis TaxID=197479 RepID=A0A1E2VCQ5_9GAMM|nr:benzoate/H(+) symporter BenE family transporter [Terasakiispira papahanaumokuakeensis]ODC04779.1 hypothetical protein BFW38_15830 [Terasakiispira papahanaumokuakeensis]